MQAAWDLVKVMILFIGCTVLFYYGMLWISNEYSQYKHHQEPEGKALKVINVDKDVLPAMGERLGLFYQLGE
ncbi:DUF4227 family protein [Bacillus sp. FSL W7-1360]